MLYIQKLPSTCGAYFSPQSHEAPGLYSFPESLLSEFLSYNGFVVLTVEGDTVVGITPNIQAWEAWKASVAPTEEQIAARKETDYKRLVLEKIRQQYSATDEYKVLREALAYPDDVEMQAAFVYYNEYVEKCKAEAYAESHTQSETVAT